MLLKLLTQPNSQIFLEIGRIAIVSVLAFYALIKLVQLAKNKTREIKRQEYNIYMKYTKALMAKMLILFVIIGCQSKLEDIDTLETTEVEEFPYKINNNSGSLSSRITYINRTATIEPLVSGLNTDRSASDVNGAQEMYYLSLIHI